MSFPIDNNHNNNDPIIDDSAPDLFTADSIVSNNSGFVRSLMGLAQEIQRSERVTGVTAEFDSDVATVNHVDDNQSNNANSKGVDKLHGIISIPNEVEQSSLVSQFHIPLPPMYHLNESSSSSNCLSKSTTDLNTNGFDDNSFTYEIGERDVLLGTGKSVKKHEGNVAFRLFISRYKPLYTSMKNNGYGKKSILSHCIYNVLTEMSWRFVKVHMFQGKRVYVDATQDECIKKIAHFLRQKEYWKLADERQKEYWKFADEGTDLPENNIWKSGELSKLISLMSPVVKSLMTPVEDTEVKRPVALKIKRKKVSETFYISAKIGIKSVIFGRGPAVTNHVGNQAFRYLITKYYTPVYSSLKKHSVSRSETCTKTVLVHRIYNAWIENSGNFVKIKTIGGSLSHDVASKTECFDKISRLLRMVDSSSEVDVCGLAQSIGNEVSQLVHLK